MRYIKKINEYMGIYRKLWSIKKSDFENVLFDLMDIAEVKVEYTYMSRFSPSPGTPGDSLQISSNRFKSPDEVNYIPNSSNIAPIIVITIDFYDLGSIEKSSEFYNSLLEAKSRLSEKFGEKFQFKPYNATRRDTQSINPIGYQFILIDD